MHMNLTAHNVTRHLIPKYISPAAWERLTPIQTTIVQIYKDTGELCAEPRLGWPTMCVRCAGVGVVNLNPPEQSAVWLGCEACGGSGLPVQEPVRPRGIRQVQYLSKMCESEMPWGEDYAHFGAVLMSLLEKKLLRERLMDPTVLQLLSTRKAFLACHPAFGSMDPAEADSRLSRWRRGELYLRGMVSESFEAALAETDDKPRCLLMTFVSSDLTREQLNAIVGFEAFSGEGDLPRAWPKRA